MIVKVYRLTKSTHIATALSGDGAWKYGGRWNSQGYRVIYTSATLSLAMLEIMVHLDDYSILCKAFSYIPLEIPSDLISAVDLNTLPAGWNAGSPGATSQGIGDSWISGGQSAVLAVPTVLAPNELNYLINPEHPDFQKIKVGNAEKLCFDPRFVKT